MPELWMHFNSVHVIFKLKGFNWNLKNFWDIKYISKAFLWLAEYLGASFHKRPIFLKSSILTQTRLSNRYCYMNNCEPYNRIEKPQLGEQVSWATEFPYLLWQDIYVWWYAIRVYRIAARLLIWPAYRLAVETAMILLTAFCCRRVSLQ